MFRRLDVSLKSSPICYNRVNDLLPEDFNYYDKDGFELNIAERKFYAEMNFPLNHSILNHTCWQEPWFELEKGHDDLILDHAIFLCRAAYSGNAREQLLELKETVPLADYLIRTHIKWGYDFSLDAIRDGTVFEVLHVEFDHNNYDTFGESMIKFDYLVRHTDWKDAADRIWNNRDQWQNLKGYAQNDWKARYLISWDKAEFTEKAV